MLLFIYTLQRLFQPEGHQLTLTQVGICGGIAGIGTTFVISPVELIKSKLQVQVGDLLLLFFQPKNFRKEDLCIVAQLLVSKQSTKLMACLDSLVALLQL